MVVNLFGAPGCGKSTAALGITHELKKRNFSCEYIPEYAKDLVYEDRLRTMDQLDIFCEQYARVRRAYNQVDLVITDSPLLISKIYDNTKMMNFPKFVEEVNSKFRNFNILIERRHEYVNEGRIHNEEESLKIHTQVYHMLSGQCITLSSREVVDCVVRLFTMRREEGTDYANYVQY